MRIIFPPRPKSKIPPNFLHHFENDPEYVSQLKFNGQRNLVYVSCDRDVKFFGRHGSAHKNYLLLPHIAKEFQNLRLEDGKDYWFDSELLDKKTRNTNYKNRIILFDVLHIGKFLFGKPTLKNRTTLLWDICKNPQELEPTHGIALRVSEHIWLAKTFYTEFTKIFQQFIQYDEIEGLVIKKINSVLNNLGRQEHEVTWQIRCRKPHKGGSYMF